MSRQIRRIVFASCLLLIPCLVACDASRPSTGAVAQALDQTDFVPPTTYTVHLSVRVPSTPAYTVKVCEAGRICCQGAGCGPCSSDCVERAINFTPQIDWLGGFMGSTPRPDNLSPYWETTAALGVRLNSGDWSTQACFLGDIGYAGLDPAIPAGQDLTCAGTFSGGGPDLEFGTVGHLLKRTFTINTATDAVDLIAMLDDTGALDGDPGGGLNKALGSGIGLVSNAVKTVAKGVDWLGYVGSIVGLLGNMLQYLPNLDQSNDPQANAKRAQRNCLGGILGNPPDGSMSPPDAYNVTLTGQQLYDGTADGPLVVTLNARMNYRPSLDAPPQGYCMAATDVSFVIDRAGASVDQWTDGLAFERRSADSAVVRRANALESFHVTSQGTIEHDSWQYAPETTEFHPTDGLARCNGPTSCSPLTRVAEPATTSYIASKADPQAQHPPVLGHAGTPIVAESSEINEMSIFFVDDNGGLYVSTAWPGDGDWIWMTWLLTTGLPPNAPLAAVRSTRLNDYDGSGWYTLAWAGQDNAVHWTDVQPFLGSSSVPYIYSLGEPITHPGAAIVAVSRRPNLSDMFVVGDSIWHLTFQNVGFGLAGSGTRVAVGPSTGQVAANSGLAAVATTTNNLDLFYFDNGARLQHVSWTTSGAPTEQWDLDPSLGAAEAGGGTLRLSAATRSPNNIDVVYPCPARGLCGVSILANTYPTIPRVPSPTLAISGHGDMPDGPFAIVNASGSALDVIATSRTTSYDASWQRGASSWSTYSP